jgi:hypothetical protein
MISEISNQTLKISSIPRTLDLSDFRVDWFNKYWHPIRFKELPNLILGWDECGVEFYNRIK